MKEAELDMPVEEKAQTEIKPPKDKPPATPPKPPKGGKLVVTKQEATYGFKSLFVLLARIFRSDVQYQDQDFDELATSFVVVTGRVPALAVIMVILAPLVFIGRAYELSRRLVDGMHRKKAQSANDRSAGA